MTAAPPATSPYPDIHLAGGAYRIWVDVTDFVEHLRHHPTFSGIQRVVSNLIRAVSRRPGDAVRFVVLARTEDAHSLPEQPRQIRTDDLLAIIDDVEAGRTAMATFAAKVAQIVQGGRDAPILPGDVFFMPGAFWLHADFDFLTLLRAQGVFVSALIHDIIPIRNENYCVAGSYDAFVKAFVDLACAADFFMTNSAYVARDIDSFMAERLNFSLPLKPVTLATELPPLVGATQPVSEAIRRIAEQPYVLCVGPLEVRKNQIYLLRVWEALRLAAPGTVPNLVLVGGRGLGSDVFLREAETKSYLEDWLFLRSGLSDVDLNFLYENCQFTMFVSLAEGWGLPIGESLVRGKPCIASNIASMPEVGGALVRYVDPMDVADGVRVVGAVLRDPTALATWQAEIRREYTVKTWHTFCDEIFDTIGTLRGRVHSTARCILGPGIVHVGGDHAFLAQARAGAPLASFRMARLAGWHVMDSWGCWARAREAAMQFATPLPQGTIVRLYLELRPPPLASFPATRIVADDEGPSTVHTVAGAGIVVRRCVIGPNGLLRFSVQSEGVFQPQWDGRVLFLGLSRLGFCRDDDVDARLDLIEGFAVAPAHQTRQATGADFADMALIGRVLMHGLRPGRAHWWDLVHALWLLRARGFARRRQWARAEACYQRLIQRGSATPADFVQYGHMLKEQELWPAAFGAYRQAVAARPDDADAIRHMRFAAAQCA